MFDTIAIESERNNILIDNKKISSNKQKTRLNALEILDEGMDIPNLMFKLPKHPFLIKVIGNSMVGAGIDSGDTLMVDKVSKPKHGDIVVAAINQKLVVKRLHFSYRETMLLAENDDYLPIKIKEGDRLNIWGVVTMVIKDMAK
ncbi:MAG TPA: S24 family peptidase [Candidatus Kapabacteria bacterium]|nr:S24 family peptidase [Candidatus Kapabacteria bacterium]